MYVNTYKNSYTGVGHGIQQNDPLMGGGDNCQVTGSFPRGLTGERLTQLGLFLNDANPGISRDMKPAMLGTERPTGRPLHQCSY